MMGHNSHIQVASYIFSITVIFHIVAIVSAETDSNPEYKRVCYYTNWSQYRRDQGKFMPADIDPFLCTHLIFAFAKIDQGVLAPYEWNDLKYPFLYKQFNSLKLKNPALKTLLAVGGWTHGSLPFTEMVKTAASRKKFIEHAMRYLRTHNFDGLDLDWEYPANRGSPAHDKQRFVELVKELREAFDKEAKKTGKEPLMLTMAVAGGDRIAKSAYEVKKLNNYVDFFNLMSYDLHGSWSSIIGHHAPLFGGEKWFDSEVDTSNVEKSVNMWLDMGAEPQKLVLGLALYGKTFKLCNKGNSPGDKSCGAGHPDTLLYYDIIRRLRDGRLVKRWLDRELVPYAFGKKERIWVGYDDEESLRAKVNFAKQKNLGGVMAWSIDSDDFTGRFGNGVKYPLLNMVKDTLEGKSRKMISMFDTKPKVKEFKKEEKDSNPKKGPNKNYDPFTKEDRKNFKRPLAVPLRSKLVAKRKQSKPALDGQVKSISPFANKKDQTHSDLNKQALNAQESQSNRFFSGSSQLSEPKPKATGGASTRKRGLPRRTQGLRRLQRTQAPAVPDVQPVRSPSLRRGQTMRKSSEENHSSPFSKDDYLASHMKTPEQKHRGIVGFSRGKAKRPNSEPFRALTEFDRKKLKMELESKMKGNETRKGMDMAVRVENDIQVLNKENVKRIQKKADNPGKVQYGTGRRRGQVRFRASSLRPNYTKRPEQHKEFQKSNKKRSWYRQKGSQETADTDKEWLRKETKSPFSPPQSRLHRQGVSNPPHYPVPYSGITSKFFTKPASKRWFSSPSTKKASDEKAENLVFQSGDSASKLAEKEQMDHYQNTAPTQSGLNWLSPTAHSENDEGIESENSSKDISSLQSASSEESKDEDVAYAGKLGMSAEEQREMVLARNRNKIRFESRESNAMAGIRKFKRKNENPHQSSSPFAHLEIDALKNRDKMRDISKYQKLEANKNNNVLTGTGNTPSVPQGRSEHGQGHQNIAEKQEKQGDMNNQQENTQDTRKTTTSWWRPQSTTASSSDVENDQSDEREKSASDAQKVSQKSQSSGPLETMFKKLPHKGGVSTTSKSTTVSHSSISTINMHTTQQDNHKAQGKTQQVQMSTEQPLDPKTTSQELTTKSHLSKTPEQSKKTQASTKSTDNPWWISDQPSGSNPPQESTSGQSFAEQNYPNTGASHEDIKETKLQKEMGNLKLKAEMKTGDLVEDISKGQNAKALPGQNKSTGISETKDKKTKMTSLEELENEISNMFFKKDAADLQEADGNSVGSSVQDNNNETRRTSTMPVRNRSTPRMQAYHSRNIKYPFKPQQNHKRFHRYNDRRQHPQNPDSRSMEEELGSDPASTDLMDESRNWDKIRELLKNSTVVSEIKSSLDQIHRSLATGDNDTEEVVSEDDVNEHEQTIGSLSLREEDKNHYPNGQSEKDVSSSRRSNRRLPTDSKSENHNPESDASKFQQPFGFSARWWKNDEQSDSERSGSQSGDAHLDDEEEEEEEQDKPVDENTLGARTKNFGGRPLRNKGLRKTGAKFLTTPRVGKISSAESHTGKYVPWWQVTGKPESDNKNNGKENDEDMDNDNLDRAKNDEPSNSIYPKPRTSVVTVKSVVDVENTPLKSKQTNIEITSSASAERKPVPFVSGQHPHSVNRNNNKFYGKRTTTARSMNKWYLTYNSKTGQNKDGNQIKDKDENEIQDKDKTEKSRALLTKTKSFSPFARYQKAESEQEVSLEENSGEDIDESNPQVVNVTIQTETTHGGRSHKGQRKRWSYSVESKEDKDDLIEPEVEEETADISEEVFDTEPETKPRNEPFQVKESFEKFLKDPTSAANPYLIQGKKGNFKGASQEILIGTSLLFGKGKRTDEFSCPSTFGIYSDKNNCKMFFQCVWYVAFHHVCGPGTAWNHAERICDWPTKTDCILAKDDRFL